MPGTSPLRRDGQGSRGGTGFSFSLASLLLFMVLVASCLGVGMYAPWLGLVCATLSVPAYIRTAVWAHAQRRIGYPLDMSEKIAEFFQSCGVVTTILMAFCWAFVSCGMVVLLIAGVFDWPTSVIVFCGLVAAVYTAYRMGRVLWPHRRLMTYAKLYTAATTICPDCLASIAANAPNCWICDLRRAQPRQESEPADVAN